MKKKIKTILKKFDIFGVEPNFHFKSKKKYQTAAGGMIFILIFIIVIIYTYLNLKSIVNFKKMTVISYENYLNLTEGINFENYSLTFAFGFECENYEKYLNNENINNIFNFDLKFTNSTRINNIINKEKTNINFHKCNYSDFYNDFNESFLNLGLENFYCPDKKNFNIRGDFTDLNYDYYEISLKSNKDNYSMYYNLLSNGQCKFSIIFTDYIINIKSHKNPYIKNLNQIYIQLSPVEYIKKDIFFEIQEFNSLENLFYDKNKKTYSVKFLNENKYNNFKGFERFDEKPENFDYFGKFFLRAERKTEIIERHYEKINDFLEKGLSMFINLIIIFFFFCSIMNTFFLYNSIIKKIFLYKLSDLNHDKINVIKNFKVIMNFFSNKKNNSNNQNKNRFNTSDNLILNDFENSVQFLKLNNNNKNVSNNNLNVNNISNINNSNNNLSNNNYKINNNTNIFLDPNYNNNNKNKINLSNINKNSSNSNNFEIGKNKLLKNNTTISYNFNNKSYYSKLNNLMGLSYRKSLIVNKKRDKSSIIITELESIVLIFFPCFASKKLKNKRLLDLNIKDKIYNSLDILSYFKNSKVLDFLKFILLEKYESNLINFISKPCVSLANKYLTNYRFNKNHKIEENELNAFFSSYKTLVNIYNKNESQKKIIDLVDKEIEKIVI